MVDTSIRHRTAGFVTLAMVLACVVLPAAGDGRRAVQMRGVNGGTVTPFAADRNARIAFFVATDCPVSNSYAPEIQRVCREYAPRGVGCALIYEDLETGSDATHLDRQVRAHLAEYGYAGIDAGIDRDRAAARAAKATVTPQAVVVD